MPGGRFRGIRPAGENAFPCLRQRHRIVGTGDPPGSPFGEGRDMSNIVDFPAADRPITEGQIENLHSQAFRDLEGRLCDCISMAIIARQLAANEKDANNEMVFAVAHAAEMLEALKVDYYAAYHGENPLEP
jgi:hypothetical protein